MRSILAVVVLGLFAASAAIAARSDFPQPRALEPDVRFWKRIYSEVGTDGGLIHDTHDLGLVYEVVKFPSRYGAERHTEARKRHYVGILRTLAAGKRSGLTRDEKRVLAMFGRGVTAARLRLAAERLRFQLGQADKFRAGVIRSGAYLDHIRGILRDMNLPLEIAHLPHVESSFTPNIYSRVGAAGLWQFTSATGRRFMRVDHVVDERLDPYRASLAAARLLDQNYRVTGTWPLAITSYNHGASGMRRAAQQLGTRDIARIVRNYRSPSFGFASRNFYVEFLAADHVASNHERYFGKLDLHDPISFETVTLPYFARARDLANAFGVDVATLERANPSLRPGVWRNSNLVPKGFALRLPASAVERPLAQALTSVPNANRYASRSSSGTYVVRRGDTLSRIASRHGTSLRQLSAMNGIRRANSIRVGQRLKVPVRETLTPMPAEPVRETMVASRPPEAETPRAPEPAPTPAPNAGTTVETPTEPARASEPVLASNAAEEADDANAGEAPQTVTRTYVVRRGDSLTRIARIHGVSVRELAASNGIRRANSIRAGQRLKIVKPAAPGSETPATGETEVQIAATDRTDAARPEAARPEPARSEPPRAAVPRVEPAAAAPAPRVASAAPRATPIPNGAAVAVAAVTPGDDAVANPELGDAWEAKEESATDPSPGLLADPSDYTIADDRTITVQPNETLGHYAEWLGVRASRLRQLNRMRYGEPVVLHQKIRLDFAHVTPDAFERTRVEYHRALQEAFFDEWEIEGTSVHKVGPGDSIWSLSTRRFAVPIWLLRQYNPDVDLDSLSAGTQITVPKLKLKNDETSARDVVGRNPSAG